MDLNDIIEDDFLFKKTTEDDTILSLYRWYRGTEVQRYRGSAIVKYNNTNFNSRLFCTCFRIRQIKDIKVGDFAEKSSQQFWWYSKFFISWLWQTCETVQSLKKELAIRYYHLWRWCKTLRSIPLWTLPKTCQSCAHENPFILPQSNTMLQLVGILQWYSFPIIFFFPVVKSWSCSSTMSSHESVSIL